MAGARMRRRIGRLALAAAALAVAAAAAEGWLRLRGARPVQVNREQALFWRHDPQLGWHHRPGARGRYSDAKRLFTNSVAINAQGLRDNPCAYERTPGRRRILVLGDSFAWGFGVEQDETFSERLERSLPDTEVINAGVSGYSTDQELLWFEREGTNYRPDVVVLCFTGNDEWMNRERLAYYIYYKPWFTLEAGDGQGRSRPTGAQTESEFWRALGPERRAQPVNDGMLRLHGVPVPRAAARTRAIYWLRQRSALARTMLDALAAAPRPPSARGAGAPTPAGGGAAGPSPAAAQPFALTRALIARLAARAAEGGARFIVVANAFAWRDAADASRYADFVAALRADGHAVIDVESLPSFDRRRMVIPGDGHWNAAGHACVAEALRRALGGGE